MRICPVLPASGKVGTPWLRMQAEYACGSCARVWFALVMPTCATFAPDEPPHAEAAKAKPATPRSASAVRALTATIAIEPVVLNGRLRPGYIAAIAERS
jgi:hypothetical protein